MALHQTGAKIGMACMLFLSFCGWVVSIGGTAHATNECRENTDEWKENDTVGESGHLQPFPGDSADEDRAYDCGVHFSLDWWIIAFQLFMIIFGFLAVFVELFHTKFTVMNLFAIATALFTLYTSIYVKLGYQYEGGSHSDNTVGQGFKTAAAGGIIVCVCNYIFMFIFGSEEGASGEPESKA
uniref:MARVEL domain-containing protein n=2 Tax=Dunaliella tertiolecta TaxID=3047 RepID=A0A7S3R051_DUNTE|mmetsp:Transcript_2153/g.5457  ORF Transcript_2153/g.5457 Transcript_2153/m.5457 type:complete len:183 (+) Transcript_2153:167-715(+)